MECTIRKRVWTGHLIPKLQQYNVQIKPVSLLQIEPQQINDSNLMINEITSEIQRTLTTKSFNVCRLSARVTYLSEH